MVSQKRSAPSCSSLVSPFYTASTPFGLTQTTPPLSACAPFAGFHSCGTLLVLSVPGLTYDDFDHLPTLNASTNPPTGSGFLEAYEDAASQVKEDDSYEMTIEAWTRGYVALLSLCVKMTRLSGDYTRANARSFVRSWARSCGKGAKMKEVRVAKLDVGLDGASVSERPEKMVALGTQCPLLRSQVRR